MRGDVMGKINYDKLFLTLRIRDIKGSELIKNNIVSAPTIIKLKHGQNVTTDVLIKLCDYLDLSLADICEYKPEKESSCSEFGPDCPFC